MRTGRLLTLSLFTAILSTGILSTGALAQQKTEPALDAKQLLQEGRAALRAKQFDVAAAAFKKLTDANPKDGEAWHMLGYSLHAAGKLDEALPAHLKATEFPESAPAGAYNVACVHALQGKSDDAFVWLEKAVAFGFRDVALLEDDADLTSLRADARFGKVMTAMKANPAPVRAFVQAIDRKSTRVALFGGGVSPGQFAIDYSPVIWQDSYDAALAAGKLQGQKWRLGSDFWTTLDTSTDLQFGSVTVPAGYYYLTLEQRDATSFVLALHEPNAVKKQRLDASQAAQLKGGIEVPVVHSKRELAGNLSIEIEMAPGASTRGTLNIRFGAHCLATPVSIQIPK